MFGKLQDWRRIHTRYDRCAHTFMSAICIAATVIFWINQPLTGWRRWYEGYAFRGTEVRDLP